MHSHTGSGKVTKAVAFETHLPCTKLADRIDVVGCLEKMTTHNAASSGVPVLLVLSYLAQ